MGESAGADQKSNQSSHSGFGLLMKKTVSCHDGTSTSFEAEPVSLLHPCPTDSFRYMPILLAEAMRVKREREKQGTCRHVCAMARREICGRGSTTSETRTSSTVTMSSTSALDCLDPDCHFIHIQGHVSARQSVLRPVTMNLQVSVSSLQALVLHTEIKGTFTHTTTSATLTTTSTSLCCFCLPICRGGLVDWQLGNLSSLLSKVRARGDAGPILSEFVCLLLLSVCKPRATLKSWLAWPCAEHPALLFEMVRRLGLLRFMRQA